MSLYDVDVYENSSMPTVQASQQQPSVVMHPIEAKSFPATTVPAAAQWWYTAATANVGPETRNRSSICMRLGSHAPLAYNCLCALFGDIVFSEYLVQ